MKKRTLKTEKVLAAYTVLGSAKYGKLSDDDKIKVFKICIALKPIATKYDEASKEAEMKLKPDGYDERLEKAREYDRVRRDKDADASQLAMGPEEFNDFMREVNHYQDLFLPNLFFQIRKMILDFFCFLHNKACVAQEF